MTVVHNSADFFVGTYSQSLGNMPGYGRGIYHCCIDLDTGRFGTPICVAPSVNPSYLAWGPMRACLYATREVFQDEGPALLAFGCGKDGALELLNSVAVAGELPCHLAVDQTGKFLASAQYKTGNGVVFRLLPDGRIGQVQGVFQHHGTGPNPVRQEGPHAHFVAFLSDPDELAVVDLGLDRIICHPLNVDLGDVDETTLDGGRVAPGAGPRHFVALPGGKHIYVYSELSACIFHFVRDAGTWTQMQMIPAFDEQDNAGAAIRLAPNNRVIYVSERSRSEIVAFSVDPVSGALAPLQCISTGGLAPRDFGLTPDGRFMVVANQQSNTLNSFMMDPDTGRLRDSGHDVDLGSPVCVLF